MNKQEIITALNKCKSLVAVRRADVVTQVVEAVESGSMDKLAKVPDIIDPMDTLDREYIADAMGDLYNVCVELQDVALQMYGLNEEEDY